MLILCFISSPLIQTVFSSLRRAILDSCFLLQLSSWLPKNDSTFFYFSSSACCPLVEWLRIQFCWCLQAVCKMFWYFIHTFEPSWGHEVFVICDEDGAFLTNINPTQQLSTNMLKANLDKIMSIILDHSKKMQAASLSQSLFLVVREAPVKKLTNNRAYGEDGIPKEWLEFWSESIDSIITSNLHGVFSNHENF